MPTKIGAGGENQPYDKSNGQYTAGAYSSQSDGVQALAKTVLRKQEAKREKPENKSNDDAPIQPKPAKERQFEIIQKENPMTDDYHQGIRSVKDIKTWEEAMQDDESFEWGDFSRKDAETALKTGQIKIYSSYPIKNGVFVSTSYNQSRDYAGGGKVYSMTVPLDSVAWINGDEGQFAKIN